MDKIYKDFIMEEIWKPVLGYEELYEASNLGRIRSLNYGILKYIDNHGYCRVRLCKNGDKQLFTVHRVIWEAFNGKIPEGLQINHKDEVKSNNILKNLEIVTPGENIRYGTGRLRAGLKKRKPVNQIDKDTGEVIKTWPSVKSARLAFGPAVRDCLANNCKTAFGFLWKYA